MSLIDDVRARLAAAGDPQRAAQQQAYMKSDMPFRGVRLPQVRRLVREAATAWPVTERAGWRSTVVELWDDATHREERYAAQALARLPRFREFRRAEAVEGLWRHFIVTGRWWDLVDGTAPLVEEALEADPAVVTPVLRAWAVGDDVWLRRSAIIAQLGRKGRTDTALLRDVLDANIAEAEFFIAKACGWALRQHARTDATWVRDYLANHDVRPLTRREASKHLS